MKEILLNERNPSNEGNKEMKNKKLIK